jgi:dienelactone hydrolase
MKLDVESHWTTVAEFAAFVAFPQAGGPWPGIVVFQEIFGVNSHIREVCARIAAHGYVAIAPDLFHRTVRQLDIGYGPDDIAQGRKHKEATTREGVLADAQACIAALKARGDVRPADIGCIGFCFGGQLLRRWHPEQPGPCAAHQGPAAPDLWRGRQRHPAIAGRGDRECSAGGQSGLHGHQLQPRGPRLSLRPARELQRGSGDARVARDPRAAKAGAACLKSKHAKA